MATSPSGTAVRRGIVAGFALGLASGWNIANVGAIASTTAVAYGVGLAAVGLFTTALFIAHTAVQIPGGRASDRFGARRVGIVSLALIGTGGILAVVASDPALALAARAVTGSGTGLAFIAGATLVRESGGSPFAQGVFGGIGTGGGGLALAIVPQLEGPLGWRAPYWSSLVIATAALALILWARPAGTGRPSAVAAATAAAGRSRGTTTGTQPGLLRDPRLIRLAVLYSCSYAVTIILANWVVELLQVNGSLSDGAAAIVGSLVLLVSMVSRPLGGWLLRAHPAQMRSAMALSLVAGAAGTLALAASGPSWLAAIGAVLVGIGAGVSFAPVFVAAASTRPDAPASSVGFVNGIANFVVLVGTPLLGLTFSHSSAGRLGFLALTAFWLLALAFLPSRRALGSG